MLHSSDLFSAATIFITGLAMSDHDSVLGLCLVVTGAIGMLVLPIGNKWRRR